MKLAGITRIDFINLGYCDKDARVNIYYKDHFYLHISLNVFGDQRSFVSIHIPFFQKFHVFSRKKRIISVKNIRISVATYKESKQRFTTNFKTVMKNS